MDFSFAEFAIIGIVALLVIGPDKLPGLARTAGLWVGKVRGFINSVKSEIDAELKMDDIKNAVKGGNTSLHEISEIISDTRNEFRNSINPDTSSNDSEKKPEYQVKAIPDDFVDEDDAAHNDVEDDFIDDYNSDYQIDEIETSTKSESDSETIANAPVTEQPENSDNQDKSENKNDIEKDVKN
ncbi:MAG: Sec-independent protein translocase protein TatB [Gammaproteobacteria bacterium]